MKEMRKKIYSCWLGKTVGGTLGMPFEGCDGPLDVSYYDPVPEKMVPNDDLDLQVVWACVLSQLDNPRVNRYVLGQAWLDHVNFPWDEYGVAIRNLHLGLKPPLTGSYDNWFINGMGAAIRSELWACLAPGDPALAASYAYEDACVDHAEEGIWAAVFLAALESMAFVETDQNRLLDTALNHLPETSLVRQAVNDTRLWWQQEREWLAVRNKVLNHYGHENFTDVTMNMAFAVLSWLAAEGDFSKAICTAVNCGKDTDCTAATVGALMGILNPDGIDEKWLKPIGTGLVLSPEITGLTPPETLDSFTDLVLELKDRLGGKKPNCEPVSQMTKPYRFHVDTSFVTRKSLEELKENGGLFRFPQIYATMELNGALAGLKSQDFTDEILLLRYKLKLDEKRDIRLVFNTPQSCRVWVDGKHCFCRESGRMAPSPHRAPAGQYMDLSLSSGKHDVIAAVARPTETSRAEWVIVAADAETQQWIPDAFI